MAKQSKNLFGRIAYCIRIGIRPVASGAGNFFLCLMLLCVSLDSRAETSATPRPHQMFKGIKLHGAWYLYPPSRVFDVLDKLGPDRRDSRVELTTLVSSERNVVAGKCSDQEPERAAQNGINCSDELKDWVHVLTPPAVGLLFGLIVGGAFSRPREHQKIPLQR